MGWPVGLAFAFGSAVTTSIGFLLRHRGAVEVPDVDGRHPLRSIRDLFAEKWWTIGFGVAIVAWLMHVTALKLAPLSFVQAVLASGFVALGVAAERYFGFELRRREWTGIALTTAGLVLLAVTAASSKTGGSHSKYAIGAAVAFEAGLVGCGALFMLSPRVERVRGRSGALLGVAAGLLFTVSHIGIKALSHSVDFARPSTLLTPWIPIVVGAAVVAFFVSARSLQIGPAVPVIALTAASSNLTAILAGIVVFGDPLGSNALLITMRIAAFALVIVAAALLPAPVRAAGAEKTPAQRRGRSAAEPVGQPG
jgi:drug/metabolite transporter (DMT)-like permease